jgi:hypothetical protein
VRGGLPGAGDLPDNGVPEKWASFIEKNRKHFENK